MSGFTISKILTPKRALAALITVICWTVVALISLTRHYMEDAGATDTRPVWKVFLIWLTCYYTWALLTPIVFWVARRWPFTTGQWGRSLLVHSALTFVFTSLSISVNHFLYSLVMQRPLGPPRAYIEALHFTSFLKHFPLYWTTLVVANLITAFRNLREKERLASQLELERSQLETSLRQAQLDALRMQLNPHFLFNTLQTISVLMMDDTTAANRMLVRLSDLLRSTLRSSVDSLTCLRDEIAFLESYLEIEQIRFADRLCVRMEIDPAARNACVPTLLLQPLVENAIRHGIARMTTEGTITIRGYVDGDRLQLSVVDTGPGLSDEKTVSGHGIGLNNTRKRLKQMYPDHDMEILSSPANGFEVRISIPLVQGRSESQTELVTK